MVALSFWAIAATAEPWRLDDVIAPSDRVSIGGSYRARAEFLRHGFRAGANGGDQILVHRLLVNGHARGRRFYAGAELMDSRAWLHDGATPLGTDDVNAAEVLQAYVGLRTAPDAAGERVLDLKLGRMTVDIGSRRYLARNGFRNTINAFDGIHAQWTQGDAIDVNAFYLYPVSRHPSDLGKLRKNAREPDERVRSLALWGIDAAMADPGNDASVAVYYVGLAEDDDAARATRNRELHTIGSRLTIAPDPWRLNAEIAAQFGRSRESSSPSDTIDLDHLAVFVHAEAGRTFNRAGLPRLLLRYDYASGDRSAADDDANRYDTLFGARGFDFGPTGIYGALARSNISSPGASVTVTPAQGITLMASYRAAWLASRRDAMVTSGLRDPSGDSGSFIGHQLDARVRWRLARVGLQLQAGAAYLRHGEFLRNAPEGPADSGTTYVYAQTALTF